MTITLRIASVLIMFPVLVSCGGQTNIAPVTSRSSSASKPTIVVSRNSDFYTVRKGDTLYSIAWQHGYDYKIVAGWNDIAAPYRLNVGQKLRIRSSTELSTSGEGEKSVTIPAEKQGKKPNIQPEKAAKQDRRIASAKPAWRWPTNGKIIQQYSSRQPGKKGIVLSGKNGQSVFAASDGRVVYSGSGLVGYGKLIIIKHNAEFLSAYGHNKTLLVKEGDRVKSGQQIAEMGKSGAERVMLHFEIRRDGKPVNPLLYLPKQRS